ncbi:MAG TPA: methionine--tRNA ligase [Polyangiaceae bacterium]|nr:methionine--tRNA ligase [Polyangiaceae bacterium]
MSDRFFITTPIYYINSAPHLGTAYTTIAADVLKRYHGLRGRAGFFLTGTDEHGLKIERVAKARNLSVRAFAAEMSVPFREMWPKLDCPYDYFVRTTDVDHEKRVGEIWERMKKNGDLYLGSYEGWYCVGCEAYYTEKELEPGGICPLHKTPAERIRESTYFFKLAKYQDRLLSLYDRRPSFVQPITRMNEVKSFVRGGLEDISVSRTTFSWGVPVPNDPAHVMYVWFDALFSYLTPMLATPERRAFWPANVHMMGKDILRFHAVYWPAFLLSAGFSDDELPRAIFAHGFLTVNGQKMSKSRGNTIQPLALAEAFGIDTLRYYLMRAIAFGQDGDFNVAELIGRHNADLGNALGNLCNRVLKQTETVCGGKFPLQGEPEDLERALLEELAKGARAAAEAFDAMQPHRALEAIWQVVGAANQYIDRAAPWAANKRGDIGRASTILGTALEVLGAVSTMVWPVIPRSADAMRAQIGLLPIAVGDHDAWPVAVTSRRAGEPLGVAAPIFPRIDAEKEARLLAEFGPIPDESMPTSGSPAAAGTSDESARTGGKAVSEAASGSAPSPATIPYDDFAKLDLRVGVVLRAERVAGKDKLLSLSVDVGEPEPRPLVAGLALSFKPEDLVGMRVIVVANLEPRKFGKGLVSHGMLLAAGPSEALTLVTVGPTAAPGTKVK